VALIVATCGSARADLFDFSYSGAGITASGTLTATLQSGNTYLISAITGTRNGQSITGLLAPSTFAPCGCNDNLLYFPAGGDNPDGNRFIDVNGFAFSTAGGTFDPFVNGIGGPYMEEDGNSSFTSLNSFDVTESVPAPIPGAGALSYLLVLLGGAWRWRKTFVARARRALSTWSSLLPRRP